MRYCEFCVISKNDYLVEHVQTVASDILGYPYVEYLLQGPYWRHSSILTLIHFKLILESCTKVVFRTISNIYDEAFLQKYLTAFGLCIFAEMLHRRYLIGFCIRLCSLVFLYFSTFFVWILDWTMWRFCYYSESVLLLSSHDLN